MVGDPEPGLRHGPLDLLVPGAPPDVPRRRSRRVPFPGLLHAQRTHRGPRRRHRRPRRDPLQPRQLQRLRAPARDGPDAVDDAVAGRAPEGQEGRDGIADEGRRGSGPGHEALPRARRLCRRVRAPRLRVTQDRAEGRPAPVRLPQDGTTTTTASIPPTTSASESGPSTSARTRRATSTGP